MLQIDRKGTGRKADRTKPARDVRTCANQAYGTGRKAAPHAAQTAFSSRVTKQRRLTRLIRRDDPHSAVLLCSAFKRRVPIFTKPTSTWRPYYLEWKCSECVDDANFPRMVG